MLDETCNDHCSDGLSLPRREGNTIFAACRSCGTAVAWDTTRPLCDTPPCEGCGLPVAEAIVGHDPLPPIELRQALSALADKPTPQQPRTPKHDPVVYFAQAGEHIKIGTSGNLWLRMNALHAVLLGVTPGSFAEETAMHKRFAHLHVTGELFRDAPDLRAYIAAETTLPTPPPELPRPLPNPMVHRWKRMDIS